MRRACWERFPRRHFQRKPLVSNPTRAIPACITARATHVPWCMPGSLTCGGGENVPGIPGACATYDLTYLARGPCKNVLLISHDPVWRNPIPCYDVGSAFSLETFQFVSKLKLTVSIEMNFGTICCQFYRFYSANHGNGLTQLQLENMRKSLSYCSPVRWSEHAFGSPNRGLTHDPNENWQDTAQAQFLRNWLTYLVNELLHGRRLENVMRLTMVINKMVVYQWMLPDKFHTYMYPQPTYSEIDVWNINILYVIAFSYNKFESTAW